MVQGLGVQPGEVIQVRDHAGRQDVLLEVLLAIEQAGGTPLPELTPPGYLERLWTGALLEYLERWDLHRGRWMQEIDRVLVFTSQVAGRGFDRGAGFNAWERAIDRLTEMEESRGLPILVAAIPTRQAARDLDLSLEELENLLLPALQVDPETLQDEIQRVLAICRRGQRFSLQTGEGCTLTLDQGDRQWFKDDAEIDAQDRAEGAVVSNLPAGSIYTTVLEEKTVGEVFLPKAGPAVNVILRFAEGRVVDTEADSGAKDLEALFDSHSGEPRRVSHIGIGLNPRLERAIGWTIVDEHVYGHMFICLGENRYMGGLNQSSLNIDFAIPGAVFAVDRRIVIPRA
jgi:leucyl aminopeptidase (aminopeptidase T)